MDITYRDRVCLLVAFAVDRPLPECADRVVQRESRRQNDGEAFIGRVLEPVKLSAVDEHSASGG